MVDLVSPGVAVKEKDLSTSVRSEPTSIGAVGIISAKGPMSQVITIASEDDLVRIFGKPNTTNYQYWFSAASFLMYSNTLKVIRIETAGALNATADGTGLLIKNKTHYQDGDGTGNGPYDDGSAAKGIWGARTAGSWGNSLTVSICNDAAAFSQASASTVSDGSIAVGNTTIDVTSGAAFNVGDIVYFQEADGQKYKISAISTNTLTFARYPTAGATGLASVVANSANIDREWQYADQFDRAPGTSTYTSDRSGSNDELHIIIVDKDSKISGVAGSVLEKWEGLSKASDALTSDGTKNYYVDVLADSSEYIYWLDHPGGATNWGSLAAGTTFTDATDDIEESTGAGGAGDTTAPSEGERQLAYKYFEDADTEDVNLVIAGPASVGNTGATANSVFVTDLVEKRKDCVGFISPDYSDVVNIAKSYTQTTNVKGFFDALNSSSYTVFDSGYTKQFDKYNDVYRWVPLNGHIAGCCARTDALEDPWWSPAGIARGQIRGSISLAYNPTQTERDTLYRARINPVVTFPGEGTMLFGDKTGLARNSAFSRINVRRLFLTIEEACKLAARSVLFEFNDQFTRDNFKGMVDPYLRDIQGRRGITDFLVVCDDTNNTPQVIDNNEFRADIYVKPARSINFITLTFIATRTGVDFAEVVGRA
jgi:hypothetical protein